MAVRKYLDMRLGSKKQLKESREMDPHLIEPKPVLKMVKTDKSRKIETASTSLLVSKTPSKNLKQEDSAPRKKSVPASRSSFCKQDQLEGGSGRKQASASHKPEHSKALASSSLDPKKTPSGIKQQPSKQRFSTAGRSLEQTPIDQAGKKRKHSPVREDEKALKKSSKTNRLRPFD